MKTRFLQFGGSAVALEYCGERPARLIDFLYQHVPPADSACQPHITYRLTFEEESQRFFLSSENSAPYQSASEGEMAEYLLGQTCYHLVDRSHTGLMLHAAGVRREGQGIILPGASGAGKTTLTAWLLSQGFQYLTDELVLIPHRANELYAFPRPLNLKTSARPALQHLPGLQEDAASILRSRARDLVPPGVLTAQPVRTQSAFHRIIFPHYRPNVPLTFQPLSQAQAGLELMKCLANGRNLPAHGFPDVTRVARLVPAFQLTYSDFSQLEGVLNGRAL